VAGKIESELAAGSVKLSPAPEGELIKLSEAARQLGCHIETLRLRVRRGELAVVRGALGTYYLTSTTLAELRPPRPFRSRVFNPESLEWSWQLLEKQLPAEGRSRQDVLGLIARVRENPELDRRLYRLLAVKRLRAAGLRSSEIALHIGISTRQVRRLAGQNLVAGIARALMREQARKRARVVREARAIVADLQRQLEATGFQRHRRLPSWPYSAVPPGRPGLAFKKVWPEDAETIRYLRQAGLSKEQIEAIQLAGIGADELNELVVQGLRQSAD